MGQVTILHNKYMFVQGMSKDFVLFEFFIKKSQSEAKSLKNQFLLILFFEKFGNASLDMTIALGKFCSSKVFLQIAMVKGVTPPIPLIWH